MKTMLKLESKIEELKKIPKFLEEVKERFSISKEIIDQFDLILDERLINIINDGYNRDPNHWIKLKFYESEDKKQIILKIIDEGTPFNPLEYPKPDLDVPIEERKIGDLGIYIVLQSVDDVQYERVNNQNILILYKNKNT